MRERRDDAVSGRQWNRSDFYDGLGRSQGSIWYDYDVQAQQGEVARYELYTNTMAGQRREVKRGGPDLSGEVHLESSEVYN